MASKPWAAVAAVVGLGLGTWFILSRPSVPGASRPVADVIANPLSAGSLQFRTLARGSAGSRILKDDEGLAEGEALHFQVRVTQPGHLLIARLDRLGGVHLVYPTQRGGQAVHTQPSRDFQDLGQSVERLAGTETLVAVLCGRPFVFDTVRQGLRADRLDEPVLAGCAQATRRLNGP